MSESDSNSYEHYYERYLRLAPFALALWRSLEAGDVGAEKLEHPILDLGCGFGEFAGVFSESTIEVGVDTSKDIVAAAHNARYSQLLVADARELPFKDGTFNSVISISVIEHIEGAERVFPEVYRVLKPGGAFVFTVVTAAINDTLVVPDLLRRVGLDALAELYIKVYHLAFKHVTLIGVERWKEFASAAGFSLERVEGTMSRRQLFCFEAGLPTALLTQLSKVILGRRLPFQSRLRARFLYLLGTRVLRLFKDSDRSLANVIMVAQKPGGTP